MHSQLVFNYKRAVYFFALCFSLIGLGQITVAQANSVKQEVQLVTDWQELSVKALEQNLPIVMLVEISSCRFCKTVRNEFLNPLSISKRYQDKVIFSRISLDSGQTIIGIDGNITDTHSFCANYEAVFTPTIVFMDGRGEQLTKNIVGISSNDYFGYYLEKEIEKSIASLQAESKK